MKTKVFSILLSSIILVGCNSEKADFEKAEAENRIPGYEAFLEKYPQGKYKEVAAQRIDSLKNHLHELDLQEQEAAFLNALAKDDLQTYRAFVEKYPNNEYVDDIREKMKFLTNKSESLPTYSEVVATYPKNVSMTTSEAFIYQDENGGIFAKGEAVIEYRDGKPLVLYYGAKLTAFNKLTMKNKIFLAGDKITFNKNYQPIKVRSWD